MGTGTLRRMSNNYESQQKMINKVIAAGNYVHHIVSTHLKPFGLSSEQYHVLEILSSASPQPVTFTHIQEKMNNKSSNVTRLVDKLVEWGFVSRELNPVHRRKMDIKITKEGKQIMRKVEKAIPQLYAEFGHMSKAEVEQLNELLAKLKNAAPPKE